MKQYEVLCNYDNSMDGAKEKLKRQIEEYLMRGWRLQGGVSISVSTIPGLSSVDRYFHIAQAVVREA